MPQFDLPLESLWEFRHPRRIPSDHEFFWTDTLEMSRTKAEPVQADLIESDLTFVDVFDVKFSGFNGENIRAWWLRPTHTTGPLPTIVEFLGHGGGRGKPHERLLWAAHGFCQLVVDSRGQGGIWNTGDTEDPHGHFSSTNSFLTKGIEAPESYYYRRLYADVALSVDAASTLPGVDPQRIGTYGHSQGGALALVAAALNSRIKAVAARAPFLCGIARSIAVSPNSPYSDLADFLGVHRERSSQYLATLDYFDVAFFMKKISIPVWFSLGLSDLICPPSGVFTAINNTKPENRTVNIWPYNSHESGGAEDENRLVKWFRDRL